MGEWEKTLLQLSPFFASIFPLFPKNAWSILRLFLFSRCVPDFCDGRRSFPTNENSNLVSSGTSAMDFAHYQSPKLLGSRPPITQVSIFDALSISDQIHRENQRENCGDYPIYLGRSAKSESPDRLGFSWHMKTRLKSRPLPSPLTCDQAVVLPLYLGNEGKRTRSFPFPQPRPQGFSLTHFLKEKPWGRGCLSLPKPKEGCLVRRPRPHYSYRPIRFGSPGVASVTSPKLSEMTEQSRPKSLRRRSFEGRNAWRTPKKAFEIGGKRGFGH